MTMMEKLNRPALKEYAGAIAIVLGALPALTGMVISIVSSYRGEPEAQKAYTSLSAEVNNLHDWMEAVQLTLSKYEGREEGLLVAKQQEILAQLAVLTAENEKLKADAQRVRAPELPVVEPPPPPPPVAAAGAGFGSGAGRLGGSRRVKKEEVVDLPPPPPLPEEAPAATYEAPPSFQEYIPQKKLPTLNKLPGSLDDL